MEQLNKSNNTLAELKEFLSNNKNKWIHFYYTDGEGPSVGSADGTEYENFVLADDTVNSYYGSKLNTYDGLCEHIIGNASFQFDWRIKLRAPDAVLEGGAARIDGKGTEGNDSAPGCQYYKWWMWGYEHPEYLQSI